MSRQKLIFLTGLLLVGVFIIQKYQNHLFQTIVSSDSPLSPISKTQPPEHEAALSKSSLFVPYWALSQPPTDSYDVLLYFGITPTTKGINTNEPGYANLSAFSSANSDKKTYLVLRMINSKTNFAIIENRKASETVIRETMTTAKEYDFDGVVLDFEVTAIPFDSVVNNITTFTKSFASEGKKRGFHVGMTMYGDTFYRVRPFDMKAIGQTVDEVLVMTYDFSKANGNPGPNFPFGGKEKYGYDFQEMVQDFMSAVPPEKLTIIFGMYGYDWPVDEKGNATGAATAVTLNQIKQKFLPSCEFENCRINRDTFSSEQKITYQNEEGVRHIVWFEDEESVAKKKAYLKSQGVTSTSFWAHSYF